MKITVRHIVCRNTSKIKTSIKSLRSIMQRREKREREEWYAEENEPQ